MPNCIYFVNVFQAKFPWYVFHTDMKASLQCMPMSQQEEGIFKEVWGRFSEVKFGEGQILHDVVQIESQFVLMDCTWQLIRNLWINIER